MLKQLSPKIIFISLLILSSCVAARDHVEDVSGVGGKLTVGTVQREIKVGMSGSEVATVLGSPNIVSTDENRNEVWIYDKIATTKAYSTSAGGVAGLFLGVDPTGGAGVGGAGFGSYNKNAGATSSSQQTLTVIIKFDSSKRVRDFAYNTARF